MSKTVFYKICFIKCIHTSQVPTKNSLFINIMYCYPLKGKYKEMCIVSRLFDQHQLTSNDDWHKYVDDMDSDAFYYVLIINELYI